MLVGLMKKLCSFRGIGSNSRSVSLIDVKFDVVLDSNLKMLHSGFEFTYSGSWNLVGSKES